MNDARAFFILGLGLVALSAILAASEAHGLSALRDRLTIEKLTKPGRREKLLAEEGIADDADLYIPDPVEDAL